MAAMRILLFSLLFSSTACAKGIVTDPWDSQMRVAARRAPSDSAAPAATGVGAAGPSAAPVVRSSPLLAQAGDDEPMTASSAPQARVAALPARQGPALELPRSALNAAIAAGPQRFMAKVLLDPFFLEGRFVGFSLTRFYEGDPRFASVDLRRGDVVTRVNGLPIGRPHQFMRAWDELRRTDEIKVEYLRGAEKRLLRVRVTGAGAKLAGPRGSEPRAGGPIDE